MFNALSSVVTLIGRDPELAQRTVVRLADVLRATLRTGDAQEVALQQEIELTRRYLEIEEVRFADRLTVKWHVPERLNAMVPAFALQPLVENALIHGKRLYSGNASLALHELETGGAEAVLRVPFRAVGDRDGVGGS